MPQSAIIPGDSPRQRPLFALLIRLGAAIMLATMFMLVKVGDRRGIDLPQMIFVRQFLTLPVLLGWLAMRGQLSLMRSHRLKSHAMRAVSGTTGMVLNFAAPILLPLAVAATLGFTAPIFAVILTFFLLREHVGPWRWSAAIMGFIGILLVTDPFHARVPLLGVAVGIGAAFMVALVSIQIRDLTRSENPIAIVTWFAIFSSPVLFAATLLGSWDLGLGDIAVLLGIGFAGIASQLMLTVSLRMGSVASVIVMDYSMLLWATFYGWAIFDNLPPETLWLGAPLIILAGAVIIWRERINSRRTLQENAALPET